jgi:hypothetical protein
VGERSDREVHDLRTVEITYVLLRSILSAGLPLVVLLVAHGRFEISLSGSMRVAAISLYSLLLVGVLVRAVVSLRRFERRVRQSGASATSG